MNRVLVAVDSSIDRRLVIALLESDPNFLVVGEAENGVEAVDLAVRLEPDMVAIDLDMPLMNGVEATQAIMERRPTRIVVLTSSEIDPNLARGAEALQTGALSIVPRPDHPNSPQFTARREIFMEMIRVASRKVVGSGRDPRSPAAPRRGAEQGRTRQVFDFTGFEYQPALDDSSPHGETLMFGQPYTIEDRAARLRRLLDEIEGEF
jgi:two-component system chemotaxis response regulator CheB